VLQILLLAPAHGHPIAHLIESPQDKVLRWSTDHCIRLQHRVPRS